MRSERAFTLIELMVTVAVLAIVISVAVPSFNRQIENNRSVAVGEDFANALAFARSEAVKRGRPVTLCASNDAQTACDTDWSKGWLAVTDTAGETAAAPAVGEVLQVWAPPPATANISVERAAPDGTGAASSSFIRYTGLGTMRIGSDPKMVTIQAYTNGCSGDSAQELTVGVAGSTKSHRIACPQEGDQ